MEDLEGRFRLLHLLLQVLEAVGDDPRVLRLRVVGGLDVGLVLLHLALDGLDVAERLDLRRRSHDCCRRCRRCSLLQLVLEGLDAAERLDLEDARLSLQVLDALCGDVVDQLAQLVA